MYSSGSAEARSLKRHRGTFEGWRSDGWVVTEQTVAQSNNIVRSRTVLVFRHTYSEIAGSCQKELCCSIRLVYSMSVHLFGIMQPWDVVAEACVG